ncbi:MAG: glutathione synthase, partial [Proteobacteria bacterium]|nr:glutathione synthase [Pseudomonadota bacterium]
MKKHFKIAIQMDPLESINIKSDSTYILALEAQKRGYRLFHYLPENLIY